MSYDITLNDPISKETIEFESKHLISGGMYVDGGTSDAWLNITYNYADWYYMDGVFPKKEGDNLGIRTIYGMTGAESIPVLKNAISVTEFGMEIECKKMDYKELIERLEYQAASIRDRRIPNIFRDAALAIETLLEERETMKKDLKYGGCETCRHKKEELFNYPCRKCYPEIGCFNRYCWRGFAKNYMDETTEVDFIE